MDNDALQKTKDACQLAGTVAAAVLANLVVNQMPWQGQLVVFTVGAAVLGGSIWLYFRQEHS